MVAFYFCAGSIETNVNLLLYIDLIHFDVTASITDNASSLQSMLGLRYTVHLLTITRRLVSHKP